MNNQINITGPNNDISLTSIENKVVVNESNLNTVEVTQPITNVVEVRTGPIGPRGEIPTSGSFNFTGSYNISGSLIVSGSIISTDGFTGSLEGTSSWADNAISSSYALNADNAVSASNALTASFAPDYILISTTSSMLSPYVLTSQTSSMSVASSSVATSASYAVSASYLIGGVTIDTGSLLTTASVNLNTITFTKGDGSVFPITVDTGSGGGSSQFFYQSFPPTGSIPTGSFWYNSSDGDLSVYIDDGVSQQWVIPSGSVIFERRSDFQSPYLYCGEAPQGTPEGISIWNINRITINTDGTTLTESAVGAWTNRYSLIYT